MRLFVDISGSVERNEAFMQFLAQLSKLADGYFVLFDHQIQDQGDIKDLMDTRTLRPGGGTDTKCLSAHLGGAELKVMVTDGMMAEIPGPVTNLLIVDPTQIKNPKKLALMLSLADDEFPQRDKIRGAPRIS